MCHHLEPLLFPHYWLILDLSCHIWKSRKYQQSNFHSIYQKRKHTHTHWIGIFLCLLIKLRYLNALNPPKRAPLAIPTQNPIVNPYFILEKQLGCWFDAYIPPGTAGIFSNWCFCLFPCSKKQKSVVAKSSSGFCVLLFLLWQNSLKIDYGSISLHANGFQLLNVYLTFHVSLMRLNGNEEFTALTFMYNFMALINRKKIEVTG